MTELLDFFNKNEGNGAFDFLVEEKGKYVTVQDCAPSSGLEAAFFAVHLGFHVFPCNPRDKKPLITEWPEYATQDAEIIRDWWSRYPDAMVGACTGHQAGYFVVDIDVVEGEDAYEKWAALEKEHGALNPVFVTSTPSGGLHLFCVMPKDADLRNSTSKIAKGVDIRANGGYVIFAGSTRYDGKQYRMLTGGLN